MTEHYPAAISGTWYHFDRNRSRNRIVKKAGYPANRNRNRISGTSLLLREQNLEVRFDNNLTFRDHISEKINKAYSV